MTKTKKDSSAATKKFRRAPTEFIFIVEEIPSEDGVIIVSNKCKGASARKTTVLTSPRKVALENVG